MATGADGGQRDPHRREHCRSVDVVERTFQEDVLRVISDVGPRALFPNAVPVPIWAVVAKQVRLAVSSVRGHVSCALGAEYG